MPLLCICRGLQELNVALGGSLHQHVQEVPGRFDHRSDKTKPLRERYGLAHPVRLTSGGTLQGCSTGPSGSRSTRCTARASIAWRIA